MKLLFFFISLLCTVMHPSYLTQVMAAESNRPDQVRELRAEMQKLLESQPKLALAKGLEALALLKKTPDARQELMLLELVASLQLENGENASALKAADDGTLLATRLAIVPAQLFFRIARASVRHQEGNYTEAARIAGEVVKEAKGANDSDNAIKALLVLGQCAGATGNFPQGIQYLHQALELAGEEDQKIRQKLLSELSTFYIRTQEWTKALKFNQESFAIAKSLGSNNRQAILLVNASLIHSRLNHADEELRALLEAEVLGKTLENKRIMLSVEVNLSDVLLQRKDFKGALERAEHGLEMAKLVGDKVNMATALINRGSALNHLGHHSEGLASLELGLKAYQAMGGKGDEAEVMGVLSDEYAFAGNLLKALAYQKAYKEKSDQLFHDARAKAQQEIEARYQSEKQEKQILQLTLEGDRRALVRNFSIAGAVLGLALAMALLARYRLLRHSSDQMRLLNGKLENLTVTDPLTGLRNRRFFMQQVEQITAETVRAHYDSGLNPPSDSNQDLIFFMVDLDHFKFVNDTYGHNAGDQVLKQAVARLLGVIRDSDELIRWGGEEFLLVARKSNRKDAPVLAERLRAAIAAGPFDLGDNRLLERTCSIGFAAFPLRTGMPERPSWEAVVELADQALYVAKSSGRNGWLGVSGAQQATGDMLESQLSTGLHSLVEQGLCDVRHSFPDNSILVWEKKPNAGA
jgi:diguanylate cyclase (GGDEF)-like protein